MKKIEFILDDKYPFPVTPPIPAKNVIPLWYRDGESFVNKKDNSLEIESEEDRTPGMKSCIPFLDAITSGYVLTTWTDIEITENHLGKISFQYIKKDKNGLWVKDTTDWNMIGERQGSLGHTIPKPHEFSHNHMIWRSIWGMRLPRGWSMLATHPLNQYHLPFFSLSAIMDSDRWAPHGNMPFFIQKGWTGIIEKGTPYIQLIPIKRSKWISLNKKMDSEAKFMARKARSVPYGFYRSNLWVPKSYKESDDV